VTSAGNPNIPATRRVGLAVGDQGDDGVAGTSASCHRPGDMAGDDGAGGRPAVDVAPAGPPPAGNVVLGSGDGHPERRGRSGTGQINANATTLRGIRLRPFTNGGTGIGVSNGSVDSRGDGNLGRRGGNRRRPPHTLGRLDLYRCAPDRHRCHHGHGPAAPSLYQCEPAMTGWWPSASAGGN